MVPDFRDAEGRGSSRRFSARNLLEFAIALRLRELQIGVAFDKDCTMHVHEGVNRGFHDDTTPRYYEEAATLAQVRTIESFRQRLG